MTKPNPSIQEQIEQSLKQINSIENIPQSIIDLWDAAYSLGIVEGADWTSERSDSQLREYIKDLIEKGESEEDAFVKRHMAIIRAKTRDLKAEYDSSPYHETKEARIIAFRNGWDACLQFIEGKPDQFAALPKPRKIVCYCGSLRVALEAFKKAEYEAVLKGEIALLPCCMFVDIEREYGAESDYKQKADDIHKRKIDICDEVMILNVGGYIGASTRSELEYAQSIGKPIKYLEP